MRFLLALFVSTLSLTATAQSYNYDLEWEAFKEAVYAKNAEDLAYFFHEDFAGLDAETMLMMLSEDYVIEALKKTAYTDLGDVETDGNYFKEFAVGIEFHDEESGETFESGIFIHFEESMSGRLKLTNFLAAG